MTTVVDSLVIEFGLDPAKFNAGQKQVVADIEKVEQQADKSGRKMEESGKRAANFYSEITKELVGLIGAFAGADAVGAFALKTTQADAALGRTAMSLDMNASALARWEGAARRAGAAQGSVTSAFQNISQQIQRFQLGESSALVARAAQLGVTLSDKNGQPLSPDEIFEGFADKMKGMDPRRALAIGREIGMPDDVLSLLLKGRSGIEGMLSEQDKIGHTTQKDVDAASKLQSDITALDEATTHLGEMLTTLFSPMLDRFVKSMTGIVENLEKWVGEHPEEAKAITGGAVVAGTVAGGTLITRLLKRLFGGGSGAAGEAGGAAAGESLIGRLGWVGALLALGRANLSDMSDEQLKKQQEEFAKRRTVTIGEAWRESSAGQWWARNTKGMFGAPLGIRNNNPGNLRYVGQVGASYGEGGFAHWETMGEGIQALDDQIKRYERRGLNTIRKIISTYAPKNENNTEAYIKAVAKSLGIDPDQLLEGSDAQNRMIERGIIEMENGQGWAGRLQDYLQKIGPTATPNASQAAPVSSNHSEVHIGKVDVHTQATEADSIARDFTGAVSDYITGAQANAGLA